MARSTHFSVRQECRRLQLRIWRSGQESVYDSCIIAAGTYPGQEEDVSTVGVKAVLLASDSVSAEVVEELTALLFEEQQELDFALPVELITDADAAVAGISVPFHKGAERYYESRGEKSEN